MATKALSDHTTEELKDQALEDLRTCVSNLLRATLCIHQTIGVMLLVRAEHSAAVSETLDEAGTLFSTAGARLTRAAAAWEVVVQRGRKKK
jgi:hypothetical protein